MENNFKYRQWELYDAISALMAYDLGSHDSGVKDADLKNAIKQYFELLSNDDFRMVVSKYVRQYMTDEALAAGYGIEDVLNFVKWFRDELGFEIV